MDDEIEVLPNGFIVISYEYGNKPFVFRDAIVIPQEQFDSMSPEELETKKQARYEGWIYEINNPRPLDPNLIVEQEDG